MQLAGINPIICLIKTYAFAGFIAGIAGIITLSRIEAGMPTAATGWEFQAVAVTLLGGTLCVKEKAALQARFLVCFLYKSSKMV